MVRHGGFEGVEVLSQGVCSERRAMHRQTKPFGIPGIDHLFVLAPDRKEEALLSEVEAFTEQGETRRRHKASAACQIQEELFRGCPLELAVADLLSLVKSVDTRKKLRMR